MNCSGSHRYFCATDVLVESEGKLCVLIVCTSCGESKLITHAIFSPSEGPPKNKITQLSKGN